jgi:hypothetical protein
MISPYRLMIINHSDTDIYNDIDWDTHSPSSAYRFFVFLRHH